MPSIFAGLPNNLIIEIVQIENDRRKHEKERMKFGEVIYQLNILSTYVRSIRNMYYAYSIIKIIQIENDRRKHEKERMKRKYNEVIKQLNNLSTYSVCGVRSFRDMYNTYPAPGWAAGWKGRWRHARFRELWRDGVYR